MTYIRFFFVYLCRKNAILRVMLFIIVKKFEVSYKKFVYIINEL